MKTPSPLKKGSTIGVAAPSFGATTEPYESLFNRSISVLTKRGYTIQPGKCCFLDDGKGISTSPEVCARELEYMYLNPSVDAIISCGGGECMCETAGYIDFEKLKNAEPKWFMGYSDNTNFIFPLVTISKTCAVYGPCFPAFGKIWEQCEEDAFAILENTKNHFEGYEKYQSPAAANLNPDPFASYVLDETKILTSYLCQNGKSKLLTSETEIKMQGTLLGGCMDVLSVLSGTRLDNMKQFNAETEGIIWVLEACDFNVMDIRRNLWHLDQCGWFEKTRGFIFGRPLNAYRQEMMGVDEYNAAADILSKYNVPLIFDADIGHIDPALSLIMGKEACVTVKGSYFSVDYN